MNIILLLSAGLVLFGFLWIVIKLANKENENKNE